METITFLTGEIAIGAKYETLTYIVATQLGIINLETLYISTLLTDKACYKDL